MTTSLNLARRESHSLSRAALLLNLHILVLQYTHNCTNRRIRLGAILTRPRARVRALRA
jgi:hypothetical protein